MPLLRIGTALCPLVVLMVPSPCDGFFFKHSGGMRCGGLHRKISEVSAAVKSAVLPRLNSVQAQLRHLKLQRPVCPPPVCPKPVCPKPVCTPPVHCQPPVHGEPPVYGKPPAYGKPPVRDCSDLPFGSTSGVYRVWVSGLPKPVPVYCDTSKGGGRWTVIQRRADITPRQNFYLNWQSYKIGFGKLDGEFWWGNEHLFRLTSQGGRPHKLLIILKDFDGGKRYALNRNFKVGPEWDGYRLHVSGYTGNAGDSFSFHNGARFSTHDRNSQHSRRAGICAQRFKGAWWYKCCHESNLNGRYLSGPHRSFADGIEWKRWKGFYYSLKAVEMNIRPV
ncbi:techylectin-5A-like [Pollicipes pollicipes]|uniref:techylectin-5A-like n=1 Tax=Pollicipes pollicipes TaxID=41117 RepID=UPI00188573A8|nr:techylectin-5A-like [Pollicipes pollicipes]